MSKEFEARERERVDLDGFTFNPTAHINYESAMLRVPDGLPKYRDFPADFGGSGEMMDE